MSTFEQRLRESLDIERRFAIALRAHGWSYFHISDTNAPPIAELSIHDRGARMPDLITWRRRPRSEMTFIEIKRSLVYQGERHPSVRLSLECIRDYQEIARSGAACWLVILSRGVIYACSATTAQTHSMPVTEKHRGEDWCDLPLYVLQTIGTYKHPAYTDFVFNAQSFVRDDWR